MANANYAAAQQWQFLYALLVTEQSNRIPTVVSVHKSAHLWKMAVPAVGVQLIKIEESDSSTQTHDARIYFWITVAVQSDAESTVGTTFTPANLDNAMAKLQTIVGDGTGKGLDAILRDKANFTVGGNAMRIKIDSVEYDWLTDQGEPTRIWAYARVAFHTDNKVSLR